MKAVVKPNDEPKTLEIREVEIPKLGPDDVLIRVRVGSICGSDVGIYLMKPGFKGFVKTPLILGHEIAGEVVEVGENVTEFKRGDKVVPESIVYCGQCELCRRGLTNICLNFKVRGVHIDGGFAEYMVVNKRFLHKIPNEISFEEASLLEPTAVVVHAILRRSNVKAGDRVAIIGPGPIGLISAQVVKTLGVERIFIIGRGRGRLQIAKEIGFETISIEENVEEYIKEETNGLGVDVVIECSGNPKVFDLAFKILRKGGHIVVIGIYPEPTYTHYTTLVRNEYSILGSYCHVWEDYEIGIKLMKSKQLKLKQIITHKFPLEKAREAFELLTTRRPDEKIGKVQLIP